MSRPIRVMLVDDSAVVRRVAGALLAAEPDIEVIATAADPLFAAAKMRRCWPDVLVLDVEMPRMDGLTFLRRVMAERPTPVVICSSLTAAGARTTVEALEAGAVAVVEKPRTALRDFLSDDAGNLVAAVRAAARARVSNLAPGEAPRAPAAAAAAGPAPAAAEAGAALIAIGASTGGPQALEVVLRALPAGCPGVLVVQHMPERFTAAFAERLDRLCAVAVREARDGDRVMPGQVLVAPGGRHMQLRGGPGGYRVAVRAGPPVNRHVPSVDVLLRSVAGHAGPHAAAALLTGMGEDGAHGLAAVHAAGGFTVAQDEATCVVFGMPRAAVRLGAAVAVLPLPAVAAALLRRRG